MRALAVVCLLLFVTAPAVRAQKIARVGLVTRVEIREAERLLADLGYWTGPVDGVFDPATKFALTAFQK